MKKVLAVLAVLAVAAAAQADLLASWNFTGSNSTVWGAGPHNGTLGANMAAATLTAVNMSPSGAANSLRFNGTSWGGTREQVTTATSYLQVSLTAAENYSMTVQSIDMRTIGSGTGMGGTAVWTDGSGTPISETWTTANSGANDFSPTLTSNPSGSSVQLRLMAALTANGGTYGLNGASGDNNVSLRINGTTAPATAVPEPATMSLLGLGALAMALRRKLRK